MSSLAYFVPVEFTLQGSTSIVMHYRKGCLEPQPTGPKVNGKPVRDMYKEAARGIYAMPNGQLYMPARAVWHSIVDACWDFMASGNNNAGMRNKMKRSLYLQEERFFLYHGDDGTPMTVPLDKDGKPFLKKGETGDLEVRTDDIVNKMKGAILSYRAEVPVPWLLHGVFRYNLRAQTKGRVDDLVDAMQLGGVQNGVGAWRPQTDGIHGQYSLARCKVGNIEVEIAEFVQRAEDAEPEGKTDAA